jgi:hypothetical protein
MPPLPASVSAGASPPPPPLSSYSTAPSLHASQQNPLTTVYPRFVNQLKSNLLAVAADGVGAALLGRLGTTKAPSLGKILLVVVLGEVKVLSLLHLGHHGLANLGLVRGLFLRMCV